MKKYSKWFCVQLESTVELFCCFIGSSLWKLGNKHRCLVDRCKSEAELELIKN